ncbi:hypothetical protein ACOMHN_033117 [Nucella lapillus]
MPTRGPVNQQLVRLSINELAVRRAESTGASVSALSAVSRAAGGFKGACSATRLPWLVTKVAQNFASNSTRC